MKTFSVLIHLIFIGSCSGLHNPSPSDEINISETLHAQELLLNIKDKKTETLPCIEDPEDAEILLKILDPQYEDVLDSYQAKLDDDTEIEKLIQNCENDCTCSFINSLLEENEIKLEKTVKKDLIRKISSKEFVTCSKEMTNNFCESSLYKKMEKEKSEFRPD